MPRPRSHRIVRAAALVLLLAAVPLVHSQNPNHKFDQFDIAELLAQFDAASGAASVSRHDLNGDGFLGGDASAPFDLDNDGSLGIVSQSIGGASVDFDESAVTDFDVLCYYAYSPVYTGDPLERDLLLGSRHGGPFVEVTFPEVIEPGTPTDITVKAGINTNGVVTWVEGVEIRISASSADVAERDGVTSASGSFTTTISLVPDENDTSVQVRATFPGDGTRVDYEQVSRRPDLIEFIERDSDESVWVSASYYATEIEREFIIYDHGDSDGLDGPAGTHQATLNDSDSGSGGGFGASGSLSVSHTSDAQVQGANEFAGASFTTSMNGTASLSGQQTEQYRGESGVYATSEFDLDFVVWGDTASFSLSGSVNARIYDVELSGPSVYVICDRHAPLRDEDQPCTSIGASGPLAPGSYRLRVRVRDAAALQAGCDGSDNCSENGTMSFSSSASINLSVSHGPGAAALTRK